MDKKTSILVRRQVPEYVREEYPLFLTFLEAYYEFLENKQGDNKNDLTSELKALKTYTDVDESIDEFERQFYNSFAPLIPTEFGVDKAFLIKNILPLYQAKGSENSFKLLFRMLFSEDPQIVYPRENILIASDGKWKVENTLKVSTNDISSVYIGDGIKTEFKLISAQSSSEITVYVNDVLQTSGFKVLKEYSLLIFDTPVTNDAVVEVFYTSVDKLIFTNRKVTGVTSNASVVIDKSFSTIVNNESVFELYIDKTTLLGEFNIGETLQTNVFVDGVLVDVRLRTISKIKEIVVIDGGSNYNVGDPVIITTTGADVQPRAIVTSVYTSTFDNVTIVEGGAGFKIGAPVKADDFGSPFVDIRINSIFKESANSANSYRLFSDVISDIDPANTTINALDYGLSGSLSGNANTVIAYSFSNTSISDFGEIIGLQINSVLTSFSKVPVLDAESANVVIQNVGATTTNTTVYLKSFGSLGKTAIRAGGENYEVGDELIFTNKPGYFGVGAEAEVREVDANGAITLVRFVPPKISGTANVFSSNANVIGTNTYFLQELRVGDTIWINGEDKTVVDIASNTDMNVNSSFAASSEAQKVRLYGKYPVGGGGYEQAGLPTVTISSVSGTGANVEVVAVFGDGEDIQAVLGNNKPGGIKTISVIEAGKSIISVPEVSLENYGDGLAVAEAVLIPSFEQLNGKWINSDGLISDRNMRLQGLDYYIDYSYVITSSIQFKEYKDVLKQLLHPGGTKAYAEIARLDVITTPEANVTSEITQESV